MRGLPLSATHEHDRMRTAEKLVEYWTKEGLRLPPGANLEALRDFEERTKTKLPTSFREYLQRANGMSENGQDDQDDRGFSFWSLDRLRAVPDECRLRSVSVPSVSGVEQFLVFADYMRWSWAYAIGTDPIQEGHVLQLGVREPRIVAKSFESFVDMYLSDSPSIYLPDSLQAP